MGPLSSLITTHCFSPDHIICQLSWIIGTTAQSLPVWGREHIAPARSLEKPAYYAEILIPSTSAFSELLPNTVSSDVELFATTHFVKRQDHSYTSVQNARFFHHFLVLACIDRLTVPVDPECSTVTPQEFLPLISWNGLRAIPVWIVASRTCTSVSHPTRAWIHMVPTSLQ